MSPAQSLLQQSLGYDFSDPDLLQLALSHRSVGARNNERLEFLGDSILNHIVAADLFRRFPDCSEGELSRMRAALVRGDVLASVARELRLGDAILLGPGERKSGGQRRDSILADALEAVIGAILLDADEAAVRDRVEDWFASRLSDISPISASKDAKTSLQEYLQGRGLPLPDYHLAEVSGEDHEQHFIVECRLQEPRRTFSGSGSSRRRAEQSAAQAALESLNG